MKKFTKFALKIAAIFIPIGILFIIVGTMIGAKHGVYINSDWKICLDESHAYSFENYDYTGVESISVDISNAKIIIEESSNDKFGIKADLSYVSDEPYEGVDNGILKFEKTAKHTFNMFSFNMAMFDESSNTVIIYVPKNAKLEDVNLHTSNGRIEISNLNAKNLTVDSSNGGLVANDSYISDESTFTTSNGRIEIDGTYLEKTYAKTSNGKIIATGIYKGDTTLKTSNGSIEFENNISRNSSDIKADTSNGTIEINGKTVQDEFYENNKAENLIDAKTSNGSISIEFQ